MQELRGKFDDLYIVDPVERPIRKSLQFKHVFNDYHFIRQIKRQQRKILPIEDLQLIVKKQDETKDGYIRIRVQNKLDFEYMSGPQFDEGDLDGGRQRNKTTLIIIVFIAIIIVLAFGVAVAVSKKLRNRIEKNVKKEKTVTDQQEGKVADAQTAEIEL